MYNCKNRKVNSVPLESGFVGLKQCAWAGKEGNENSIQAIHAKITQFHFDVFLGNR